MKLFYDNQIELDVFTNYITPTLYKSGFSTRLFPKVELYLDKPFAEIPEPYKTQGNEITVPISNNILVEYKVFVKTFDLQEGANAGWDMEFYKRYMSTQPSAFPHELGHVLHYMYFGNGRTAVWDNIWALMGRTDPIRFDYVVSTSPSGGYHGGIFAFEEFAKYFEDVLEGRKQNLRLLQYIWKIMGIEVLNFKVGMADFSHNGIARSLDNPLPVINGRTHLPVRTLINELKDIKLRDIYYCADTQQVIVIGSNNDAIFGD